MEMKRKQSDSNEVFQNPQKKPNNHTEFDFINYYNSVPSLKSIAIIKVVTLLCRQPDVINAVMQCCHDQSSFQDNPVVENILNKLPLLPLPKLIKAEVSSVIQPIVKEIIKWLDCVRINTEFDILDDILDSIGYFTLNSLCCSSQGVVDRAKVLKQFIEANYDSGVPYCKQNVKIIYKLACMYCVEDTISSLWEKLPEETKVHYLNGDLYENGDIHLIVYWSSINKGSVNKDLLMRIAPHEFEYNWEHSICRNMFSLTLNTGNIVAVKYFWEKLSPEEIMCNLKQWVNQAVEKLNLQVQGTISYQSTNEYADILYFLLSKVSAETQREIIRGKSYVILPSLFLVWPYQRLFLPTIQTMWDFLNEVDYLKLLGTVSGKIHREKTVQNILRQLWCRSPINFKHYFIRRIIKYINKYASYVIYKLLKVGDMETVREIISYANVEEKKQIGNNIIALGGYLNKILYKGNLNVVDQFLRETSLSDSEIINLKVKIVLKFGRELCRLWFRSGQHEMIEKFLNWAFTSQGQINYLKNEWKYFFNDL